MASKTIKTLSAKQVLAKLKVSRHTLWGLIGAKKFVKPVKSASKKGLKRYSASAVQGWSLNKKNKAFLSVCAARRKALAKNKKSARKKKH